MRVLRLVVEPARPDAGVRLAGAPDFAVLRAEVQQFVAGAALGRHQVPVGLADVTGFGAHPPEVGAVRIVAPDDAVRLQLADERVGRGPVVVGTVVDAARLVGSAVPAVATIGPVEPNLEDVAIVRHEFPQLIAEVGDVFLPPVLRMVAVPRGEVHGEFKPLLAAGIGQLADHIALPVLPGGVFHAVFGIGRRPHAEPAMMLGGEDDALHPRLLAHPRPLTAIQVRWIEQRRILVPEPPLLIRVRVQRIMDERIHVHIVPRQLVLGGQGSKRRRLFSCVAGGGYG